MTRMELATAMGEEVKALGVKVLDAEEHPYDDERVAGIAWVGATPAQIQAIKLLAEKYRPDTLHLSPGGYANWWWRP